MQEISEVQEAGNIVLVLGQGQVRLPRISCYGFSFYVSHPLFQFFNITLFK